VRAARTESTNQVAALEQKLAKAKTRLEELRKSGGDPASELAAGRAELARLTVAQSIAALFQAREKSVAQKNAVTQAEAGVKEKQAEIVRLEQELSAAGDSASRSKVKISLKTARTEMKVLEQDWQKAKAALMDAQGRLEKSHRELEQQRTRRADALGDR
jgi:chromosome segregation ATPase